MPDRNLYPKGLESLRQTVQKCQAAGVDHVMYTLSTFLRTRNIPEPFITPVADPGLQHLLPAGVLAQPIDATTNRITLKNEAGVRQALGGLLRLDGELIKSSSVETSGTTLILSECGRGALGTQKSGHDTGTKVVRLQQHFMDSFCPGTIELQDAVADNIAKVASECGFPQVTLDGYESCLRTGHGSYAKNRFIKRIFDQTGNPELRFTPSNFGNYDWHFMTYVSWGEYDNVKGFRGTMIDYRLRRQLQLVNNHMPHKMGQYYPDDATSEDMEWLMAVAAGWDAGVDLHFTRASPKSENMKTLGNIVRLWMAARQANAFSESQKLGLRQTDRLYTLSRDNGGHYNLKFVRRWIQPGLIPLPASVFKISPIAPAKVESCGIDWSWTHNPGIYRKAGVSEDLVGVANGKLSEWQVTYPNNDRLQFVLRVPTNAPCAVRNPTVILNGKERLTIPVTLQPGQYLSTTHDLSRVSIYDQNHEVISEANIQCLPYRLPVVRGAAPQRIGLSAESVNPAAAPIVRLNLRSHVIIGSDI
jgi:hypothetical protein